MKALRTFIALTVAGVVLAGCAKKSDFDALKADYDQLKAELQHWAEDTQNDPLWISVEEWQQWTRNVVCDIKAKNSPDSGAYTNGPESTEAYCGTGDPNGDPEDPPLFGA